MGVGRNVEIGEGGGGAGDDGGGGGDDDTDCFGPNEKSVAERRRIVNHQCQRVNKSSEEKGGEEAHMSFFSATMIAEESTLPRTKKPFPQKSSSYY